jgi:phosphoglycolate phosphatase-like HAD superfamily hydrolase
MEKVMHETWVFDVDGTLTDPSHRRHHVQNKPKRWDLWNKEMVNDGHHHHVIQFTRLAHQLGKKVVICTGREESYRVHTVNHLGAGDVYYDRMYMRASKDNRPDDIVKKELLDQMREDGYNPVLVFDDRDSVVKMWRENGIPTFQVNYGDF